MTLASCELHATRSFDETAQCEHLASQYPGFTLFESDPEYGTYQSRYWAAQQSDLKPACRFLAPDTEGVKVALQHISDANTSFAISSGGHTSNTGFSNVQGGVTIDLSLLNRVQVSEDRKSVWIGPGAKWGDVYRDLEPERLTVAGARVSDVGVGGFVLGGGISWYGNQVGFSCDSVLAFEVVTPGFHAPTATTLIVDRYHHADLFWALKGSAGSFGVVTAIRMKAIDFSALAPMYAGAISFEESQLPFALSVLAKTSTDAANDEYTSSYLSFGYIAATREFTYNAYVANTQGHDDTIHVNDWRSLPSTYSSLRHTTILDSAHEISDSNPLGLRRSKFSFTTSVQLEKVSPLVTLFRNFAASLDLGDDGLLGMNFQPLTAPMMAAASKANNPNIFSETLVQDMIPYLIVTVEVWWSVIASERNRDAEFEGLMKALCEQMLGPEGVGWAKHVWMYPNYAASWQEPFRERRLGRKTAQKLGKVKMINDPLRMFERLRGTSWDV